MLIIAQPKSASTSLIDTIKNCGYYVQEFLHCDFKNYFDFEKLQDMHSNMGIRKEEELLKMLKNEKIIRDHLLPIKRHQIILAKYKIPVVILLRNPKHSYDSYLRLLKQKENKQILFELTDYNRLWLQFSKKYKFAKVVWYKDIVLNPANTLKDIIHHFNLKSDSVTDTIQLSKRKYTGVGKDRLCH